MGEQRLFCPPFILIPLDKKPTPVQLTPNK